MRKILFIALLQMFVSLTYGQDEPFVKSLRELKYRTSVDDAINLFSEKFKQFRFLSKEPTILSTTKGPNDLTKEFRVEALYLISEERGQLIQLYYVNGQLYQKAAFWYFEPGKIEEVEEKYAACLMYFKSDPFFIKMNKGFLNYDQKVRRLGKSTVFYLDSEKPEVLRGECGYELVYDENNGPNGFWVYIDSFNSRELDLDPDMKLPEIQTPEAVLKEVDKFLLKQKK